MNIDKERLQMIFTFVQNLVLEVGGFSLAVVAVLALAGFFSR